MKKVSICTEAKVNSSNFQLVAERFIFNTLTDISNEFKPKTLKDMQLDKSQRG